MDTMITFTLIVSALIIAFYFVLNMKPKSPKPLNLPPGPPTLPLIGNMHQLTGALPHHALRNLARKYGPIMSLQLGQISATIISSPQLAKEVFKTNDISLANRPNVLAGEILLYGRADIALANYNDYWRQMKKICTLQLLSAKKVQSSNKIREQEFNRFREFIKLSSEKPIDIHENVVAMVNNVACTSSFGNNCRKQREMLECMNETSLEMSGFHLADMFPEFEFVSMITRRRSKLTKLKKSLNEIFENILEEHQRRNRDGDTAEDETLLDVLLRVKEEGGLEFPITIDNIKAVFMDIFSGGTDTSSVTIEWAMAEMMRKPSVMKKAQAEVREAFKGKTTFLDSDLEGLSYLQSIIKETLRLHPPLPLLLPHVCREQCKIDGYDIPINNKVIINCWACGTDPEYWEDAKSFKPERFEKTSVGFSGTDYEFIPFGAGRRICPGITYASRTLEFFLSRMLYYYDWRLPHGLNPSDIDMTETDGTIVGKKIHLHLIPTSYCEKIC